MLYTLNYVIPNTSAKKEYKTRLFSSKVNHFPNQAAARPTLNKEFKMNLRSIFVGLMFFSFAEGKEDTPVTPVEKLDVTKYTGLWYEVSKFY